MNDKTKAEALRIAEAYLIRMGWRFEPEVIGRKAAEIINSLEKGLEK
jgi:uncharacterized protein (DUF169 family)